jgi:hypothetical protein
MYKNFPAAARALFKLIEVILTLIRKLIHRCLNVRSQGIRNLASALEPKRNLKVIDLNLAEYSSPQYD